MKRLIIIIAVFLFSPSICFALSVDAHMDINNFILQNSIWLDSKLQNYNLKQGLNTPIPSNGKTIKDYITEGGRLEDDAPFMRYLNHYHDPLKSWDSSGLSGVTGINSFLVVTIIPP